VVLMRCVVLIVLGMHCLMMVMPLKTTWLVSLLAISGILLQGNWLEMVVVI